uniref:Uncharacterized protein n=1 Tax=Timema monikensis TaxID=170555 RepID=A0A7R9HPL0_9NEOP|nr:unnamed protein product [Timema monikensis]
MRGRKVETHLGKTNPSTPDRIQYSDLPIIGTQFSYESDALDKIRPPKRETMGCAQTMIGLVFAFLITGFCQAAPKKFDSTGGGFVPSPEVRFIQPGVGDQLAMESQDPTKAASVADSFNASRYERSEPGIDERTKDPKFGFLTYGTTGLQVLDSLLHAHLSPSSIGRRSNVTEQEGGTNGLTSGALKLDIGGVVLGALIGLGAVVLIPKILHLLSEKPQHDSYSGYSGYGRSEDAPGSSISSTDVMKVLSRVDEALSKNNIDSSSCMQRAVCSYIKSVSSKVAEGSASSVDTVIDNVASNAVLSFMLDGTSIKQAVDKGKQGGNCSANFSKCPFNKETVLIGMRVAQVYDIDHKTYLIKLQRTEEKAILLLESGNRIHTTAFEWPKNVAPSGFSMKMRKHLKNKRLESMRQLGMDRIVDLQFGSGEVAYHIILELYDRGNIILTDCDLTIINILRPHTEGELVRYGEYGPAIIDHVLLQAGFPSNCKLGKGFSLSEDLPKLCAALDEAEQLMIQAAQQASKGYIIQKREKRPLQDGTEEDLFSNQEFHPMVFLQHCNQPYKEFDSFDMAVDERVSSLLASLALYGNPLCSLLYVHDWLHMAFSFETEGLTHPLARRD